MQKRITIRIDGELFKKIEKLTGDRPVAEYCREAISGQVNLDAVTHNLNLLREELIRTERRLAERLEHIPSQVIKAARGGSNG